MPSKVIAKQYDDDGKVVKEHEVERLSPAEIRVRSRESLALRARPVSQGGTRPDGLSREDWRVTQGAYYDDDRC
jgi:hypothetical protein